MGMVTEEQKGAHACAKALGQDSALCPGGVRGSEQSEEGREREEGGQGGMG